MQKKDQKKIGNGLEDYIEELLGWEQRDKVHHLRVGDVVGDGFVGECKATLNASRSLKVGEIKKVKGEAERYDASDFVMFTRMKDPENGMWVNLATVDVKVFKNFIVLRKIIMAAEVECPELLEKLLDKIGN